MQVTPNYTPRLRTMCRPVLLALRDLGGSAPRHLVLDRVYEEFAPSPEARADRTPSGAPRLENNISWARKDLVDIGFIDGSEHGVWRLTRLGREVADKLL